ncbi:MULTISPECIES: sporulation histidine kinase inhibitor Sda [Peribacillus]|uniref:sporulation histidine kinase inhibitor Sda n=1 Tax=Peribacillus TaxID=2675229 RepID=UPI0009BFE618|nr:sporulation histidine kinase inhibitor Sda [Peribacillus simplex]
MIINCLNRLDDELLIETYLAATKLKDSKDFVELLKNEICRRGLNDNKLFQKKFKLKL